MASRKDTDKPLEADESTLQHSFATARYTHPPTEVQNGFGFVNLEPPELAISRHCHQSAEHDALTKMIEMELHPADETLRKNRAGILSEQGVRVYLSERLDCDVSRMKNHVCEVDLEHDSGARGQVKSAMFVRDPDLLVPERQHLASDYYVVCEFHETHLFIHGFATREEVADAQTEPCLNDDNHENRVVRNDDLRPISQLPEVIPDV